DSGELTIRRQKKEINTEGHAGKHNDDIGSQHDRGINGPRSTHQPKKPAQDSAHSLPLYRYCLGTCANRSYLIKNHTCAGGQGISRKESNMGEEIENSLTRGSVAQRLADRPAVRDAIMQAARAAR